MAIEIDRNEMYDMTKIIRFDLYWSHGWVVWCDLLLSYHPSFRPYFFSTFYVSHSVILAICPLYRQSFSYDPLTFSAYFLLAFVALFLWIFFLYFFVVLFCLSKSLPDFPSPLSPSSFLPPFFSIWASKCNAQHSKTIILLTNALTRLVRMTQMTAISSAWAVL